MKIRMKLHLQFWYFNILLNVYHVSVVDCIFISLSGSDVVVCRIYCKLNISCKSTLFIEAKLIQFLNACAMIYSVYRCLTFYEVSYSFNKQLLLTDSLAV